MSNQQKIIFLVSNDLCYDQRVQRHAKVMQEMGHSVLLLGRLKKNTNRTVKIPFPHKRFKLLFEKSALFYACLNFRFFFYLLFSRYDVIWANDVDTLPAAFFAVKLRNKKIFYDSHEYFTGVPELENREKVKQFWAFLERKMLPKIPDKITVNNSVAKLYKDNYGVVFKVVRNIGEKITTSSKDNLPNILNFDYSTPFIIYQGAVNKDRGLEELINAIPLIENLNLLIVGNGDVLEELKIRVKEQHLSNRVFFTGAVSPVVLQQITPKAVAGVAIEKPTNINYINCLPNKLFDYIHAEIPVIAYPNPEVKSLVEMYAVGTFIQNHTPQEIAHVVNKLFTDSERQKRYKNNAQEAKKVLNWEREAEKLKSILKNI